MLLSVKDEEGRRLADNLDGFDCVDGSILKHIVHLNTEGSESEEVEIPLGLLVRDGDVCANNIIVFANHRLTGVEGDLE
jgi:hypothetical protein